MHYQLNPNPEGKLVIILKGKVFDVVVDIRKGSPNFGKWIGIVLSGKENDMLWVPPGFAHGFAALRQDTRVMYKMTTHYLPDKQRGIIWNDSTLGIKWPVKDPILSKRDSEFPTLDNAELNFDFSSS
jgi:dTDP-4-dehydrorhamnose 3,5-epimerase